MIPKKYVYCTECGSAIEVYRKATAQFSMKVMDLISPHKCEGVKSLKDLGIEPDPTPISMTGKFVQNLNDLTKPKFIEPEPGDRRPTEHVKTTSAPKDVLDQIASMKRGE